MDVTCDRCGTDYEFEEALVSTRGTTVKCTQCGHLFKVYRPETPVEPASDTSETHPWTVRRADGSIHRLASLADLTRLIGESAFARDDEVSRTGKAWKKLGEIDELKDFFPDSERPAPRRRRSTIPELGLRTSAPPAAGTPALPRGVSAGPPPVPPPAALSVPPPAPDAAQAVRKRINTPPQPVRFETLGSEIKLDGRDPRGEDRASAAPKPSPPRTPQVEEEPGDELSSATTSRRQAVTPDMLAAPPTAAVEESVPPARTRGWLWAAVVLLSAAAAATWLLWPTLQKRLAPAVAQDPTAEFVARADAAFATHRIQHFEDAITEYVKALAFHESDPHILSSVSRVYAVWAQELRFKVRALQADVHGARDVERRSEIVAVDKEQRQLAEQAKHYGETAARKNPGNEEAGVALADALRLTGNLVAARSELDRARATESVPSAETLRVAALLTIDEASGDLRAGVKLASQAVAQEPDLIRTRLLLARALVADGDAAGARYHLNAVAMRDRSHPGIAAVEQEIDRPQKSLPAVDAGVDGATTASGTPKPLPPNIDNSEPMGYEGYVLRGKAMLEQGEVSTAQRLFQQALFLHPSSTQARIGLGYVALEKGRPALAVEHFLPATHAGSTEALIGLADAYRRLGKLRDALKAYQNYLAREPSGPQSSIARAQVERLTDEIHDGH